MRRERLSATSAADEDDQASGGRRLSDRVHVDSPVEGRRARAAGLPRSRAGSDVERVEGHKGSTQDAHAHWRTSLARDSTSWSIVYDGFESWMQIAPELRHTIVVTLSEMRWMLQKSPSSSFCSKTVRAPELEEQFGAGTRAQVGLPWLGAALQDEPDELATGLGRFVARGGVDLGRRLNDDEGPGARCSWPRKPAEAWKRSSRWRLLQSRTQRRARCSALDDGGPRRSGRAATAHGGSVTPVTEPRLRRRRTAFRPSRANRPKDARACSRVSVAVLLPAVVDSRRLGTLGTQEHAAS